jgi:hypothetical protein
VYDMTITVKSLDAGAIMTATNTMTFPLTAPTSNPVNTITLTLLFNGKTYDQLTERERDWADNMLKDGVTIIRHVANNPALAGSLGGAAGNIALSDPDMVKLQAVLDEKDINGIKTFAKVKQGMLVFDFFLIVSPATSANSKFTLRFVFAPPTAVNTVNPVPVGAKDIRVYVNLRA